jgi:hypothetical protein
MFVANIQAFGTRMCLSILLPFFSRNKLTRQLVILRILEIYFRGKAIQTLSLLEVTFKLLLEEM